MVLDYIQTMQMYGHPPSSIESRARKDDIIDEETGASFETKKLISRTIRLKGHPEHITRDNRDELH